MCMSPMMLVFVYPIFVIFILFYFKKKLSSPAVKLSIGMLYDKVDLKKGNWALIYYPFVLIRRLYFTLIPVFVVMYPWN